jgi:methylmalonyl-CoA mutase N-terminal domain/subunit
MAKGEIGKVGVSICNKEDYMRLYDGIPMDTTSVHLQANANSIFMLAFHIVEGLRRGHNIAQLWGTCQNDILKEFISRGTWIFPPEHSLRISCDVIEYAVKNMPKWAPLSVCSYHLQEAGANFVTSMAFSICNAMEYVRNLLNRGLPVDSFGYLISTWDIACHHVSFFEIICGIRAGRRLWAKIMKERFGAKDPKSCMMRIFVGSGGIHMTRAEPLNNIIRGAISAVAAALAGVQSINIQCYDEAYSIPTDQAIKIALRTEQIVAYETDIMSVVDPLGGSYFVENLTNKIEKEMVEIINEIEDMGGALQAIKNGYMQRIITRQAYERQKAIERGEIIRVGENFLRTENFEPIPVFQIDENTEEKIVQRLDSFKRRRNMSRVRESLEALRHACEKDDENLVPYVIRAAESGATLGEMCKIMKEVLGEGVEILLM